MGEAIGRMAIQAHTSSILLASLVAVMIWIATGSAKVATITGAGVVAPVVAMLFGMVRELPVLLIGAGLLILSNVNDAEFWLVRAGASI
ncbi:hypothetical protein WS97_09600 [Burkholderia territorii]|uniref:GntT/GntP/DsdX family permease n=1 Tax=Burkholderia territorii TaxID=1503055 RepID=UPI0007540C38|nr:hypothetical protein [Burkholderia territorii]KVL37891.1 hypothetical protein WS97_09600 [Burkholderia territorii]KWO55878.1 hypothetical protein WT98_07090 [Burkholderia territorii]